LREIEVNRKNLIDFLDDIRECDKEELIFFLGKKYKNQFIKTVLSNKQYTYFLAENANPIAIGGICPDKNKGIVWLLCTNKAKQNKKFLYSYIKNKITLFKKEYDFLYNYIYRSNFAAIKWLKKNGFNFIDLKNTNDIKFFYFSKGENFDTRYYTG